MRRSNEGKQKLWGDQISILQFIKKPFHDLLETSL
jgi:hypothetical protein